MSIFSQTPKITDIYTFKEHLQEQLLILLIYSSEIITSFTS